MQGIMSSVNKMKTGEIYDILDENGKIIGRAPWEEVHSKGLLHQVAACFLFNNEERQKILLQKRSELMHQDPGLWNHSAGGHVAQGEKPENAVQREVAEELFDGKLPQDLKISKVMVFENHDKPNNNEIFNLFEAFYTGKISERSEEVNKVEWVDFKKLTEDVNINPKKYTQSFKNTLENYIRVKSSEFLK